MLVDDRKPQQLSRTDQEKLNVVKFRLFSRYSSRQNPAFREGRLVS
jgi:hypothetical protein